MPFGRADCQWQKLFVHATNKTKVFFDVNLKRTALIKLIANQMKILMKNTQIGNLRQFLVVDSFLGMSPVKVHVLCFAKPRLDIAVARRTKLSEFSSDIPATSLVI